MISLETAQGGEKKYNYSCNGKDEKCISVAGIIEINIWETSYPMHQTPEYLFPFKEHPDRNQQKSENEKTGENYINKKPQIGAPFVKNCGYNKEKKYQYQVDRCNYRTND
jgi:hypothetical protein